MRISRKKSRSPEPAEGLITLISQRATKRLWTLARPRIGNQRLRDAVEPILAPALAHALFGGFVHYNVGWPFARVAFGRALARGVDTDFRAVRDRIRTVVEIVHRTRHHHHVPIGREVVEREPGDAAHILHVDIGVDD